MELLSKQRGRTPYYKTIKSLGISYLGAVAKSAKMTYNYINNVATYAIYLAPANMSGYEVCPCSAYCRKFCLNGSGRNKGDIIMRGEELSNINKSRVKKTRLFFEQRQVFMDLVLHEIDCARKHAAKNNMEFSIRLNCTSDISPEWFKDEITGKNILELYPDVQFYDYTKVPSRLKLIEKYPNYDLTFSYNGHNTETCLDFLAKGGKVAVVFENQEYLPMQFFGYPVIDANKYDMRYLDPKSSIMGLHFHRTAENYKNGVYYPPTDDFVVKDNDENADWFGF